MRWAALRAELRSRGCQEVVTRNLLAGGAIHVMVRETEGRTFYYTSPYTNPYNRVVPTVGRAMCRALRIDPEKVGFPPEPY